MTSAAFSIQKVKKSRSLTSELIETLRGNIINDNLAPGTKLLSASDIEKQSGVSRSVVREAVAALKAEGLIVSRQGVGMFVAHKKAQLHRFEIDESEFGSEGLKQLLELRRAVELEMTSMAADNRTNKQMLQIWDCLEQFDDKLTQGSDIARKELNFQLAIASASGNRYFIRFIKFICEGIIHAKAKDSNSEKSSNLPEYVESIKAKYKGIVQAIEAQDPLGARLATFRSYK